MLECPACHRQYPEVVGAPTQVCPHCQHETTVEEDEPAQTATGAQRPPGGGPIPADAVGAVQLAARLARHDYGRYLLLALPAFVVSLAVLFALRAYELSLGLGPDVAQWRLSERMQYLGVALPLYFASTVASLATWTFIAARVLDAATGDTLPGAAVAGDPVTRGAVGGGGPRLRAWRTLVGPALALGAMLAVLFAVGLVALVIGYFVMLHWFMFAPAKLADGAGSAGAAMEASRRTSRERKAYGFTGLVVLVGIVGLFPSLLPFDGTSGIVIVGAVTWLLSPLEPLLIACFVALTSGKIALAPAPRAPSAAPADAEPPAAPTGAAQTPRRGVTACPACGTSIAYMPTGFPVDVVCPSCGKAGRVL